MISEGDDADAPPSRVISVVDAVCCVYFCAAGKSSLLISIVIDDQDGQTLATMEGLAVLAVEDLLLAAVQLGLLAPERLRRTYEELVPFGSGLPTWDASTLKHQYREWRRAQSESATVSAR